MATLLSILFFPKKGRSTSSGSAVLYTRITYKGKRAEFSTSRKIDLQVWNSKSGKARGTSEEARSVNRFLETIRASLYEVHDRLLREDRPISATAIKDIYLGKEEKQYMLLEIFQDHNDQMKSLIGKGFTKGTLQRYNACKQHIEDYLAFRGKGKDIPVVDVDHKFITGFDHYLRSEKDCAHNTAQKYIVNFKKIIRIAHANQWIQKDPFFHWKGSWKSSEREFLTDLELQEMAEKDFDIPRLELVRDIFLFCCYTGLAFADVKKLSSEDIVINISGKKWIKTKRQKTKSLSSIPLLELPEAILQKYADHPHVTSGKGVLPVLTNQKSNSYLKEIADVCGIKKNLTTHLARHTFATTVTLSKGVPIESVGKMLGHRSLKTTQIYAKVLDEKVGRDMEILQQQNKVVEGMK
ncbi:site-specific integrase [Antarcticibacterium flavum]|uniref:Site-specific integrase n=1 Tax=Antarcticibacterium flavum TaxID=2058175 RepID=A0A5B7X4G8_9FLAO|nr:MULTISPECIES: site-specific integrase [Antarcticibacterium]MCM4159395.1 recombinase [Antarcticibacterium sp. W02-3]QCY69965.1 site-specific integrase [Antarcticibacterium flavum]